jgi:hypothetical protein
MKDITYIHLRTELPLKTRYEIKPKHHVNLSVISSLIVFGFFFNDMLILNFTQYFNQSIYNEYNTQKCIRILVYIFSNLNKTKDKLVHC